MSNQINTKFWKQDLSLIIIAISHFVLFYRESTGINYLIFDVLLLLGLIYLYQHQFRNGTCILSAVLLLISGFCCFYFGTSGFAFQNMAIALWTASFAISPKSSLVVGMIHSVFTIILSPIHMIMDLTAIKSENQSFGRIIRFGFLTIIPLTIGFIFLCIYASSNLIFWEYIKSINLDIVGWESLLFLAYGIWIAYLLVYPKLIKSLQEKDLNTGNDLDEIHENFKGSRFNFLSIDSEIYIVIGTFVLLNLVIAANNCLDLYHIYIKNQLPNGISFSEYIHQGIFSLIFSIILAIILIMYLYNSRLNFIKKSQLLKLPAYIWIIQNMVLIWICVYKNYQYVINYGYTYKRLGVYFFLALCMIGLGMTAYKLLKNKNNIFLIRGFSWTLLMVMIAFNAYDWDRFIAVQNFQNQEMQQVDLNYLITLDHTAYPELYRRIIQNKVNLKEYKLWADTLNYNRKEGYEYLAEELNQCPEYKLASHITDLKNEVDSTSFLSSTLSKRNAINEIYGN